MFLQAHGCGQDESQGFTHRTAKENSYSYVLVQLSLRAIRTQFLFQQSR